MKLSEKGLHKIQTWKSAVALGFTLNLGDLVFDSDDFVGGIAVNLTEREAKSVNEYFHNVFKYYDMPYAVRDIWDEVCKNLNSVEK